MSDPYRDKNAGWVAILVAFTMIAVHIAAKANRDAIFLSTFPITDLPRMVIGAAVTSIVMVLLTSWAMVRWGPQRLVPLSFGISGVTYLGIWGLYTTLPQLAAIALYVHVTAIGVILISGFWSLINERYDPHTAKKVVGRVVAAGTLGGLVGGIGAERFAAWLSVDRILLVLGGLQLVCAVLVRGLTAPGPAHTVASGELGSGADQGSGSALTVLRKVSYLRNLGLLVVLGTMAAAILDYVYKAHASARFTDTQSLVRFFAVYYVVVSLVTFGVQSLFSRRALERLGLGRTSAILPLAAAAGSLTLIFVPRLAAAVVARAVEAVLRSSLFRSAYELFFIPISKADKRATKSIIDVGFDRLGDVIGGGLIAGVLVIAGTAAHSVLLGIGGALSVLALLIVYRLQRGYVDALEQSLVSQTLSPRDPALDDPVTRSIMMRTVTNFGGGARSRLAESMLLSGGEAEQLREAASAAARKPSAPAGPRVPQDPLVETITELRSGDADRIRRVLERPKLDPALAAHLIPLVARADLERDAVHALRALAPRITGQLLDALLDSREEFIIRRRIPKVLVDCPTQRAVDGLIAAFSDRRFEVRYKAGIALASLHSKDPALRVDPDLIYEAVVTEAEVDRRVWQDRRLLDSDDDSFQSIFVDDLVRSRAERSLEHVFTMLSLAMDRESLKIAYRGLHTDDKMLRGTALEYLDVVLPPRLRETILPLVSDAERVAADVRTPEEAEAALVRSSASIELNLEAIRTVLAKQSDPTDEP